MPDLSLESRLHALGHTHIAGVDEVGRGPLAGPVVAAAVILPLCAVPEGIDDSKRLGRTKRTRLAAEIEESALVGIGQASVEEIDAFNILQASLLAMSRAIAALPIRPGALLIDGNRLPHHPPCPAFPIVKGDSRSLSIAAASIVAKNCRDLGMLTLAQQHPGYGWERNMGYGTREHLMGLKSHGATPLHRRSFRPVRNILYQENFGNTGTK